MVPEFVDSVAVGLFTSHVCVYAILSFNISLYIHPLSSSLSVRGCKKLWAPL